MYLSLHHSHCRRWNYRLEYNHLRTGCLEGYRKNLKACFGRENKLCIRNWADKNQLDILSRSDCSCRGNGLEDREQLRCYLSDRMLGCHHNLDLHLTLSTAVDHFGEVELPSTGGRRNEFCLLHLNSFQSLHLWSHWFDWSNLGLRNQWKLRLQNLPLHSEFLQPHWPESCCLQLSKN